MKAEIQAALRRFDLRLPLAAPALGVFLGDLALPGAPAGWLAAAGLLALLLAGLDRKLAAPAFLAAGLAAGGLCAGADRKASLCPPAEPAPVVAELRGLEPEADGRFSLTLELRAREGRGGFTPLRCPALVSAGRREPWANEGDVVYLPPIAFEPPAHLVNPGSGDSAAPLDAEGVERVGSLPDGAGLLVLEPSRGPRAFFGRLRRRFTSEAERLLPAGEARAVLLAVGLGRRGQLGADARDRFQEAGLAHLLNPGGLYLALLLACALLAVRRLWGSSERLLLAFPAGRAAAALCLPLPFAWALLEGGRASCLRAAGIGTAWLAARALGRGRPRGAHLWSAAALVAFGLWPRAALDPTLWLLGLLLLGLWALGPPLADRLGGPERPGLLRQLRRLLGRGLAFALAGFVAALPYAAFGAHRLSWLSLPAQLAALPLACATALGSWLAALLAAVHPALAAPALRLAFVPAQALAALAGWAARPDARLVLPSLPWPLWIALAIAGGALAAALRGWRSGWALAALALAVFAAGVPLSRLRPRPLRLTFLSVGQGDAAVIELPLGGALAVDGGGSAVGSFETGRRVVAPFLWSRGLGRLRALVLSHPHPDHANGLPYLLASFEVGELWSTREPCPLAACTEIERLLRQKAVPRRLFTREQHALDLEGVHIEALYPLAPEGYFPELAENDNSLVLRLSYGGFTALLTGDIEAAAEARLVSDPSLDLSADVLKAPHHGSDTSSGEALVGRVHPKAVVFCVGPRNRFGFPIPEVAARWRAAGASTYRTDEDGAVTFESTGNGFRVETALPAGASPRSL
ncbi:MAG: ComEC/Rec2 family competence protein [Myxococcales bacterium]